MSTAKTENGTENGHTAPVPDHARTVLVPIANPETAPSLLTIAASLADEKDGRVVALAVVTDDTSAEERSGALEDLEAVVSGTGWVPGVSFEMTTRSASTVSRGILDAAAETGADMILLGVRQTRKGDVVLGPVVESVMSTASADVVVVRLPPRSTDVLSGITRVMVGVDGSDHSALRCVWDCSSAAPSPPKSMSFTSRAAKSPGRSVWGSSNAASTA
jgi:nucleotide-binding universal stress UspA family protein